MRVFFLLFLVFIAYSLRAQQRYDVVIDEIMADPSPPAGLPSYEWIELRNTSSTSVNLEEWRLVDASGQSGPFPFFLLQPDSCVVVCSSAALPALSALGPALSVTSFPSLDNDGETILLRSAAGSAIHAVAYAADWLGNDLKKEGGWTLEMIDSRNPCQGRANWTASIATAGGTPGHINAVDAANADDQSPVLVRAYTRDSNTVILVFDESLDSLSAAGVSHYTVDGGLAILGAIPQAPLFQEVELKINRPLSPGKRYQFTATILSDCSGNGIEGRPAVETGLPTAAAAADFIINELLFNPRPGGFDYVEFFNPSDHVLDASALFIGVRAAGGAIGSISPLSTVPYSILPGDYLVITPDTDNLARQYLVSYPSHVWMFSGFPSLSDEEGDVVVMDANGSVVDEVHYLDDWQFRLIADPEGIALERIDPRGVSQDPSNWHSAAATAGYGTPGYQNSQYRLSEPIAATIQAVPDVFSPDNDGRDDLLRIHYSLNEPGYVANSMVFDARGNLIRVLARNIILGNTGYWSWDGLTEKGQLAGPGIYIVLTELFNLQGKRKQFRNVVVSAAEVR